MRRFVAALLTLLVFGAISGSAHSQCKDICIKGKGCGVTHQQICPQQCEGLYEVCLSGRHPRAPDLVTIFRHPSSLDARQAFAVAFWMLP
jgi:hypothetical protein